MRSMYIGSGDVVALMSGITTESHRKLLRRFVSDEIPHYNAKRSPINALRAGAILEDRFFLALSDEYLPQYKVVSKEMDVCRATLDFAKVEHNKVVDFIELKTVFANDYLDINMYRESPEEEYLEFIRKHYKHNYEQVQYQLFCSELDAATLCYLEVQTYDDEENIKRNITPDEYIEFRIPRNEEFINSIRGRCTILQQIKNYYVKY
ncbi:hypothetical protein D0T84_01055 [Dysgonomonas sp. 521]|uniref:hypothetical protein n=1 Tax=Dysgonomonas sp. 521 TaxID=2302932 RepID=UPI0013CFC11B|nr:hypothetical protein [Dysgonomonas sp. 521]NDV93504.1 hypothetical protein [Dysgonomonas sp. 521]